MKIVWMYRLVSQGDKDHPEGKEKGVILVLM
jgi:hypothetical protein